MIHKFKQGDDYILLDVNGGAVHLIDEATFKILDDFEWHWFNLAGYEELSDDLNVLTVTYGEYQWFSLRKIHDTKYERKGGLIRIFER